MIDLLVNDLGLGIIIAAGLVTVLLEIRDVRASATIPAGPGGRAGRRRMSLLRRTLGGALLVLLLAALAATAVRVAVVGG